ncbi:MAG: hypothetical protein IKN57_02270, partial [Parasporobacterium sp.]|nr:hypothetical protein [Parasporobacterium sp.]
LLALNRQGHDPEHIPERLMLVFDRKQREKAIALAGKCRKGHSLALMKKYYEKTVEDYISYAGRQGFSKLWYLGEDGETIDIIDVASGEHTKALYSVLAGHEK